MNEKLAIIYLIVIITNLIDKTYFKSGPCTPNLDVIIPPLFALISFFLVFKTLHFYKKENTNLLLIHLIGCVILMYLTVYF